MVLVAAVLAIALSAGASAQVDAEDVSAQVDAALAEFRADNDNADEIIGAAKGMLVCPSLKKLGLGIGLERGTCALRIEGEDTEFYKSTSAKWGAIAGFESHSLLMTFNDDDALEEFRTSDRGFEVGVDAAVAVAGAGMSGNIDTAKLLKEPVVVFVFAEQGLMADVSLEGTTFKKVEAEYDIARLFQVVGTAHVGRTSNATTTQIMIGIDRFVTEAERAHMVKVLRGEAEPMDREPCGVIKRRGSNEESEITYAYARKIDDFNYRVILGTREPVPFTDQWRRVVRGSSDLTVIQLNVNDRHVGNGVMLLGGEVRWDDRQNRVVLDPQTTHPIELGSVSVEDLR
jgi:lipid-binding SYLF domain-containing protein